MRAARSHLAVEQLQLDVVRRASALCQRVLGGPLPARHAHRGAYPKVDQTGHRAVLPMALTSAGTVRYRSHYRQFWLLGGRTK